VQHELVEALMVPGLDVGLLDAFRRPDWMAEAACHGEDVAAFVPSHPMRGDVPRRLTEVCNRCPVVSECPADALERPELQGCGGGTTDAQRRALRRSHAA
jgi:WhiB family redox-sensing transcriptional regulator